jgi:hypothetical protein
MLKKDEWFCSKPFEWFEVTQLNNRGGVYLCCPSWLDTPVGNLKEQSVQDTWNGETAQNIRQSILDGSFRYCNQTRCPYLQTRSGPVTRVSEVDEPRLREVIDKQQTILPYSPPKIICTYDQSCNLSCPTCRKEVIVEIDHEDEILGIQHKLQAEALNEAEYLHILGSGDPFGSPFFRKWLQTMQKDDMPKLDWIHLHTNGLLWTPKMWESISADVRQLIKSTEISVDAATPETYAVNRRGGNFEQLLKNLNFIKELRQNGPLTRFKISMVVQANNYREMPKFVELGVELGVDEIYFSQLVNWGTFTDEEFKQRAIHLPSHPFNKEFSHLLSNSLFDRPEVSLGNLTDIRQKPRNLIGKALRKLKMTVA